MKEVVLEDQIEGTRDLVPNVEDLKFRQALMPLDLPKDYAKTLSRGLREGLLQSQKWFRTSVIIPGLTGVDLEWVVAGQTAGVSS